LVRFIIIWIHHSFLLSSQLTLLSHLLPSFKIRCTHYSWTNNTPSSSLSHNVPLTFPILLRTNLFYLKGINLNLWLNLFFIFQCILSLKHLITNKTITSYITCMRHWPTTWLFLIRYFNLFLSSTLNRFNILKERIYLLSILPKNSFCRFNFIYLILCLNSIIYVIFIFFNYTFFIWTIWFFWNVFRNCFIFASYRKVCKLIQRVWGFACWEMWLVFWIYCYSLAIMSKIWKHFFSA